MLEEELYDFERAKLLNRRKLLQYVCAGIGLGIVHFTPARIFGEPAGSGILKPSPAEYFIQSENNLEMRWEALYGRGYIVPNDMFFVRNNSSRVPRIDPATWRLVVEGSSVSKPRSFSYDEIIGMPSTSVIRAIECAGNARSFFELSHGKKVPGTQWKLGGIGVAEWTGVPLREILDRAGLQKSAMDVMPEGLDEKKIRRPIPIGKAMAEDTLVVYAMNGQPLPPDHGFPVRMLVPGWVGISHVKWLGRIEVSNHPLYSDYNTKRYVLIGPNYAATPAALGPSLTTQKVKSAFELPWDGEGPTGKRVLRGRSWSGEGSIRSVELSLDDGRTWKQARLREPNMPFAWTRWDFEWDAKPGHYQLQARATDSSGNTQPDQVPFNQEGYSYWAVVKHPYTVK